MAADTLLIAKADVAGHSIFVGKGEALGEVQRVDLGVAVIESGGWGDGDVEQREVVLSWSF